MCLPKNKERKNMYCSRGVCCLPYRCDERLRQRKSSGDASRSVWFGAVTRQIDVYERISRGEIAIGGITDEMRSLNFTLRCRHRIINELIEKHVWIC